MRRLLVIACCVAACSSAPSVSSIATVPDADAAMGADVTTADAFDAVDAAAVPDATDASGTSDAGSGKDVGAPPSTCDLPTTFTETSRVVSLAVTAQKVTIGGKEYLDGCDLDGDGLPNNVLGKVASLYKDLNKAIAAKFADGSWLVVTAREHDPEALDLLSGVVPDDAKTCAPKDSVCPVLLDRANFLPGPKGTTCPVKFRLLAGKTVGTWQSVPGVEIPIVLGLTGTEYFVLRVRSATLTWAGPGKPARLCGALADLGQWQCPAGQEVPWNSCLPDCKQYGCTTPPGSLFKNDLDLDGDGVNESFSFSVDLVTAPAQVLGISPPAAP
jgi:hypothetical protein